MPNGCGYGNFGFTDRKGKVLTLITYEVTPGAAAAKKEDEVQSGTVGLIEVPLEEAHIAAGWPTDMSVDDFRA